MRILYHVVSAPSPLGLLFVAATEKGLRYLEFLDRRSLKRAIAAHGAENPGATWEPSVRAMRPLAGLLEQYFSGGAKHLNVPLDLAGSEFELKVWTALLAIPYGETRSYGEIAKAVGDPRAARAVGTACNGNPVVIVAPCHRVIGADGKLVGYVGGVTRKKYLLALEARFRDVMPLEGDSTIAPMHRTVKRAAPAPARSPGRSGRGALPALPTRPLSRSGHGVLPALPARPLGRSGRVTVPALPSRPLGRSGRITVPALPARPIGRSGRITVPAAPAPALGRSGRSPAPAAAVRRPVAAAAAAPVRASRVRSK